AGSIFKVIGELLTGNLGITALGGPITTITMTSQVASQSFRSFLEIASFIGVNLAVFNLLPIPALDGSKVVFTVIEWVRGKPISRKVEAIIHAVGFVLLLGFAVLVDILQFVI
ncbi:MAG: site-2 protease family protein, partial [Clostridia bacterium]|nr:site-2 protease family protein [Clostridia bacterium]